jgi:hypothetical protein
MTPANPWDALLRPIRSRPGEPLPPPPKAPIPRTVPVAAAALVVTDSGVFDRPIARLVPIIVYDFGL